jgi:hypothetical protein
MSTELDIVIQEIKDDEIGINKAKSNIDFINNFLKDKVKENVDPDLLITKTLRDKIVYFKNVIRLHKSSIEVNVKRLNKIKSKSFKG